MNKVGRIAVRAVLAVAVFLLLAVAAVPKAEAARCLFVSSYHRGLPWSDGIEQGLREVLQGHCELRQFDMDTKRRKSQQEKQQQALKAKSIIEEWKPDVVITADDNAAKFLIAAHYRDAELPFVFCGVNWTVEGYGFPYSNVTGMIEIAPIEPMLQRARDAVPGIQRVFYIGADTLTERKNLTRFREVATRLGLQFDFALAATQDEWLEHYRRGQDHDLVVLGNSAGINDWDPNSVAAAVNANTRRLSVTNHTGMMPFAMIGMTKVPEEQGQWAGKTALSILQGMPVNEIPIVANSHRDIWVNVEMIESAGLDLPKDLVHKAKRVTRIDPKS